MLIHALSLLGILFCFSPKAFSSCTWRTLPYGTLFCRCNVLLFQLAFSWFIVWAILSLRPITASGGVKTKYISWARCYWKVILVGFPTYIFGKKMWGWGSAHMSVDWKRCINLLRKCFRKQDMPVYWHKNSPHTYQVWQHAIMLVFCRRYCDSYTDFVEWLPNSKLPEYIGFKTIPDEGTLFKEKKKRKTFFVADAL